MSESISCYKSSEQNIFGMIPQFCESTITLLSIISHHQHFLAPVEACVSLHGQEIKTFN